MDRTELVKLGRANDVYWFKKYPRQIRDKHSSDNDWFLWGTDDLASELHAKKMGVHRLKTNKSIVPRSEKDELERWQTNDWRELSKGDNVKFERLIQRLPLYKGEIYRGGAFSKMDVVSSSGTLKQTLKKGNIIKFKGHASATKVSTVAETFAYDKSEFNTSMPYVLKMKTKGIPDIKGLSMPEYGHQREVIVPKGSQWRVKSVEVQEKMNYMEITVEEI